MFKELSKKLFVLLPIFVLFFVPLNNINSHTSVFAEETVQEVKSKIEQKQDLISKLKKEIEESKKKIKSFKGQGKTLKSEIAKLNYQEKELEKNILEKEVYINELEKTIDDLNETLKKNSWKQEIIKKNIAASLVLINKSSDQNPLEILVVEKSLSKFSDVFYALEKIQKNLKKKMDKLKIIEKETTKIKLEKEKEEEIVSKEKNILNDKKEISKNNKYNKKNLLEKTKNQEKYYQQLLTKKEKQIKTFYQDVFALEAKLKILIDPNTIPKPQRGFFDWPVPTRNLWITQYYGVTPWRKKYANGTPHRGLDFGVTIGTPLYAVDNGVVSATGDNEKVCRGVQYGKWVTIDQQNNLSTLYAHLSLIKVKPGQKVKKGDIIGYSGNSGYSTGPHLHFSIFATKGLRVQKIKHRYKGRCYLKTMRIPVISANAYRNPLGYMPKIKK